MAEEKKSLENEIDTPDYYDNSLGSIYKMCHERGMIPWETDIIKRVIRCRSKGEFRKDLKKTKDLIDLYLLEYDGEENK